MEKTKNFLLLLLLIFVLFQPNFTSAQENQQRNKSAFTEKLVYGGGFGLQFGTLTLIDLSPVIGYRLTPKLETGLGFTYKYYKYKNYWYNPVTGQRYDLKSNITGGSVYAKYHIFENVFAHTEFEQLRYNYTNYHFNGSVMETDKQVADITSVFVGGGYRQRFSQNSYFYIMALWNLTEDAMSPYNNPLIRMGVILGR
ncbi:MAG: hypothetical protein K0B15_02765 [Lentimicrobium sp.]|nr:hypothetical protein [Lentimicrobium sp.]